MCRHARLPARLGDAVCDWVRSGIHDQICLECWIGSDPLGGTVAGNKPLACGRQRPSRMPPTLRGGATPTDRHRTRGGESALLVRCAVHHRDRASSSS